MNCLLYKRKSYEAFFPGKRDKYPHGHFATLNQWYKF